MPGGPLISDVLRWRSPNLTSSLISRALKDDVIPNGPMVKVILMCSFPRFDAKLLVFHKQAGDLLLWSDWAMGRNEAVWGPDAKVFKPSRWLDAEGHVKKESQWKAHFFNGGYRLCLGTPLTLALARISDPSFCSQVKTSRDTKALLVHTPSFLYPNCCLHSLLRSPSLGHHHPRFRPHLRARLFGDDADAR
jgi:hypothetical protein